MNRRQFAGVVTSTLAVPAMAARAATGDELKFQPMHSKRRPEIGMLLYPGLTLRRIRRMGCPAALCAQEGMTMGNIPWDEFDCLFIGGQDAFKEGPMVRAACREARLRGKWVHMGRVNGLRRLRLALGFGVDSVDGTYLLHEARKGRAGLAPHDVVGWRVRSTSIGGRHYGWAWSDSA